MNIKDIVNKFFEIIMSYSVYWEEEVHMSSRGEIVIGDDGEKKRILYHKHFMKFNYIPMKQIICISHSDRKLSIDLKDGSTKSNIDYVKFGNMPMSHYELEKCGHETPMKQHYLGYYIVDEFVYVNDKIAERLKYIDHMRYMNGGYPKKIDDIICEIQNLYKGSMKTQKVAYDIQNHIFCELFNASNRKYNLTDGVQVILDADDYALNCVITDEGFKSLADNNLL